MIDVLLIYLLLSIKGKIQYLALIAVCVVRWRTVSGKIRQVFEVTGVWG